MKEQKTTYWTWIFLTLKSVLLSPILFLSFPDSLIYYWSFKTFKSVENVPALVSTVTSSYKSPSPQSFHIYHFTVSVRNKKATVMTWKIYCTQDMLSKYLCIWFLFNLESYDFRVRNLQKFVFPLPHFTGWKNETPKVLTSLRKHNNRIGKKSVI